MNFGIRGRIVGVLDLAFRNDGPTKRHIYEKILWLRNPSLFHSKTLSCDIWILSEYNLVHLGHLTMSVDV